jgi:hypothetical protein
VCGLDQRDIPSLAEAERIARETLASGKRVGPNDVTHFASASISETRRWVVTPDPQPPITGKPG